jgi:hypothetical protein
LFAAQGPLAETAVIDSGMSSPWFSGFALFAFIFNRLRKQLPLRVISLKSLSCEGTSRCQFNGGIDVPQLSEQILCFQDFGLQVLQNKILKAKPCP